MSITLLFQATALLAVLPSLVAPAKTTQPPALGVALPGCREWCGNITVPYPFGIGDGCYLNDSLRNFQLVCDDTLSPPRLRTFVLGYQIGKVSLAVGEALLYRNATRTCYTATGKEDVDKKPPESAFVGLTSNPNDNPYRFSVVKNRSVGLGCPSLSYFFRRDKFIGGCMSLCLLSSQHDDQCTGTAGCCQSPIPRGLDHFDAQLDSNFSRFITDFPSCHYTFVVNAEWWNHNYSHRAYANYTGDLVVPSVLDWAIRNVGDCSAARNSPDYACRSYHSDCVNSTNDVGYRCNCSKGYQGNPYLVDGCGDIDECQVGRDVYPCYGHCTNTAGSYTCNCPAGTSGDAMRKNGCRAKDRFTVALKLVTGVSVGVFLSVFMCFWFYLGLQKRKLIKAKQRLFEQNGGVLLQQQMRSYGTVGGFNIFSEEELKKATNNFATDRVLGRGGHGIVYRGVLDDISSTVVAIKKSKVTEAAQTKEFAKELFILSQINHRNVVKLLGCCLEVEVPMLVYEFVSNGTLYHYIHDRDLGADDMSLDTRLRIATESAEALAYMHSSASPPILHGDVKTANILLDDKLTAKVSDFGASKVAPTDEVEIATLVQGTCGYLDPEYLMTCQLTDKSDVYSFGVVLLEILTRKKALYFDGPEEGRNLVSCFVTAAKAGRHGELMDCHVKNEIRAEVLDELAHLILRCVSMTSEERPLMKEVVERLEMIRRYQHHPHHDGDLEERQGLLAMEQQDMDIPYKF